MTQSEKPGKKLWPVCHVYQSTDHEYQEEKMGIIEQFETLAADYWQGRWENDTRHSHAMVPIRIRVLAKLL